MQKVKRFYFIEKICHLRSTYEMKTQNNKTVLVADKKTKRKDFSIR